jgi:FtsP/CotA-like multicopper oxidase with cupredoxin domain
VNRPALLSLALWALGCTDPAPAAPADAAAADLGAPADAATDLGAPADRPAAAPLPAVEGPPAMVDTNPDPSVVEVSLTAAAAEARFTGTLVTPVIAYNGSVPGPMLHARVGDRVIVHFQNDLDVATTVHWHGLRISDQMDGSPRIQRPVEPGGTFTYDFVVPEAGTFWYHAHVGAIEQVERGLYGPIVVHERAPPPFDRERLVVLDDVKLTAAGRISAFLESGPDVGRGRLGNTLLVNGSATPLAFAAPRNSVERWRIVNSADARSYLLELGGATMRVIATDGGLLPTPYETEALEVAPGQRYELEVRYEGGADAVELRALVATLDANDQVVNRPFLMARATVEGEVAARPAYVAPDVTLPFAEPSVREEWALALSGAAVNGGVEFTINGVAGHHPVDAGDGHAHVARRFEQMTPVAITLRSNVSPEHPFHLHGQFFQIVAPAARAEAEPGLKDTVLVRGNQPVTVLTYFDNPGRWMFHCHIAEHSERGMMGEVEVGVRQR